MAIGFELESNSFFGIVKQVAIGRTWRRYYLNLLARAVIVAKWWSSCSATKRKQVLRRMGVFKRGGGSSEYIFSFKFCSGEW
jgi:hypothetical protein